MIDFQRLFHTGLLVPDLRQAMDHYGRALNLTWAKPFVFEALELWTPEQGVQRLRLEVTYSREGPQRLEIQRGPSGSFYDPALRSGFHLGVWVDELPGEVAAMQAQGWHAIAAGGAPAAGWGSFVYLQPPDGGLVVELVSTALRPTLERWWGGADGLG